MGNGTIFIQIAAYRDPELLPTLRDCIAKAKFPENLVFSICWQHQDDWDNLDEFKGDPRFKIIDIPAKDSKGTCWARNLLQQQYNGEKYTLQLDSHHRFAKNWDKKLLKMFHKLVDSGIPKPALTAYIPSYDPANDPAGRLHECWRLVFDRFGPEGPVHTRPWGIDNWKELKMPMPARFASAHFFFSWGDHVKEVPHDPQGYFHGEEIALAVRSYTHGYDLYHPNKIIAWHEYGRAGKKRHWDDREDNWGLIQAVSHKRTRQLFGIGQEAKDLGIYGFGTNRTLGDYERYAGVRFKDKRVQRYTIDGNVPPNPYYAISSEYDASFLPWFRHCIDIPYSDVPYRDYDFWALALHDANDNTIPGSRRDIQKEEIAGFFADPDGYCKVWVECTYENKPAYWVVWPHRPVKENDGWCDRLSNTIHEETDEEPKVGDGKVIVMKPPAVEVKLPPAYKTFDIEGDYVAKFPDGVEADSTSTILVHIPAYREPELIPTIKDALAMAMYPERVHFGICRQFNPEDGFDNVDEFRDDPRFKIMDVSYLEAKGLPWARAQINDTLLTDEDYVLQLDSHHRFAKNWDSILINWHKDLEKEYKKPIIAGYSPMYNPFNDPAERTKEPWLSGFRCFYPFGTIYIGPQLLEGWEKMTKLPHSRFLCGHFDFARSQWARDVRHDPEIYFAGEEINLTVRSYTHGYDFFHPNRIVTWHSTMREERNNICKWDDDNRRGLNWYNIQMENRRRIRVMLGVEQAADIVIQPEYGLGNERTVHDYERYAGIDFKTRRVQEYTADNRYAPNPYVGDWNASLVYSYYYLVNIEKSDFPRNDYEYILVAFDGEDKDGKRFAVKSYHKGMEDFVNGRIHYEEYFTSKEKVKWVVYWGFSKSAGWAERIEHNIN